MRSILLLSGAILMGGLFVVYGTLLSSRPDVSLRFHDTFIDRSKANKNAAWRKNVYDRDYKILGIAFLVVGLFTIMITVAKLVAIRH